MENSEEIALANQRVGEELYNNGNYTAALKSLLEAKKTLPDDAYLYNSLGLVYLAKERNELAEENFKKALKLKPDYIHAKNNLGAVYLKQGKWALAIHYFKDVAENILYATPEIAFSNLGWSYFHQKMYEEAKTYFRKALKIKPGFLNAVHGLSSVYIETGFHTQAIDLLQQALKENPTAAILHSDLAGVYDVLNLPDNAKKSWNTVLELEPAGSPLAREAQKRLLELN